MLRVRVCVFALWPGKMGEMVADVGQATALRGRYKHADTEAAIHRPQHLEGTQQTRPEHYAGSWPKHQDLPGGRRVGGRMHGPTPHTNAPKNNFYNTEKKHLTLDLWRVGARDDYVLAVPRHADLLRGRGEVEVLQQLDPPPVVHIL